MLLLVILCLLEWLNRLWFECGLGWMSSPLPPVLLLYPLLILCRGLWVTECDPIYLVMQWFIHFGVVEKIVVLPQKIVFFPFSLWNLSVISNLFFSSRVPLENWKMDKDKRDRKNKWDKRDKDWKWDRKGGNMGKNKKRQYGNET